MRAPRSGGLAATTGGRLTSGGAAIATVAGTAGAAGDKSAEGGGGSTGGTSTSGGAPIAGAAGAAGAAGGTSIVDEICSWPTAEFEFTVDDLSLYCAITDFFSTGLVLGGIEFLAADGQAVTNLAQRATSSQWHCAWPRCSTCNRTRSVVYDPAQYQGRAPFPEPPEPESEGRSGGKVR